MSNTKCNVALPAEMWQNIINYAIFSFREHYEARAQDWEEQARHIDETTHADVMQKLIVINPNDDQVIPVDLHLPENTLVNLKRTSKILYVIFEVYLKYNW